MTVNHEVEAENLKIVVLILRGDFVEYTFCGISSDFLHLPEDTLLKVVLFCSVRRIQIPLKLVI